MCYMCCTPVAHKKVDSMAQVCRNRCATCVSYNVCGTPVLTHLLHTTLVAHIKVRQTCGTPVAHLPVYSNCGIPIIITTNNKSHKLPKKSRLF